MNQDPALPPADWERFRELLLLLARMQADARWQGKLDLSGVVQQTLLEAYQDGTNLADATDAQKTAWLKRALANNLTDELRKLATARRGAGRERSLQAALDQSHSRLECLMPDAHGTPSKEAVQAERGLELAEALVSLPESQRQVIELHHLQGRTLAEVAEALGTTKPAVAGLLHRGLKALRQRLKPDDSR